MAEVEDLVAPLGGDDGGGAAAEAAVVYAGDGRVVMGEFGSDLGFRDGFGFWVMGGGGSVEGHLCLVAEMRWFPAVGGWSVQV